jgi:hypothetical protein
MNMSLNCMKKAFKGADKLHATAAYASVSMLGTMDAVAMQRGLQLSVGSTCHFDFGYAQLLTTRLRVDCVSLLNCHHSTASNVSTPPVATSADAACQF